VSNIASAVALLTALAVAVYQWRVVRELRAIREQVERMGGRGE